MHPLGALTSSRIFLNLRLRLAHEGNWMASSRLAGASLQIAAAALTAITCCSCTIRPLQGVLVPTDETVEAVSRVPILIGTTRTRSSSDPGEMFTREVATEMDFAQVTV